MNPDPEVGFVEDIFEKTSRKTKRSKVGASVVQ